MKVVAFKCGDCGVVTEIPFNKAIQTTSNLVTKEGEIKDDR